MDEKAQEAQRWLRRFVGEWTSEMEAAASPGHPASTHTGTESARMLGDTWMVSEGRDDMLMTLGWNPARGRYVGTFVAAMMPHLWMYEGTMDGTGAVVLHTEGPSFADDTRTAPYRDTIRFEDDDTRVMTSEYRGDDGQWHPVMTARFRRVAP